MQSALFIENTTVEQIFFTFHLYSSVFLSVIRFQQLRYLFCRMIECQISQYKPSNMKMYADGFHLYPNNRQRDPGHTLRLLKSFSRVACARFAPLCVFSVVSCQRCAPSCSRGSWCTLRVSLWSPRASVAALMCFSTALDSRPSVVILHLSVVVFVSCLFVCSGSRRLVQWSNKMTKNPHPPPPNTDVNTS